MGSGLIALQQVLGWSHVLVALAGATVCALNLGRSRWVWVLLGGFGLEAVVAAAYQVLNLFMTRPGFDYSRYGPVFLSLSFLGIVGPAAIVAGLALLLREVGGVTKPSERP